MMDLDKYFRYSLYFYYTALFLWLFYSMIRTRKYKHRILYELLIMTLLPFFGIFILKLSFWFQKDNHEKKIEELEDDNLGDELMKISTNVYKADVKKEMDMLSIQDVLAFNSVQEKRNAIMDLFSFGSEDYIKELQIALNDEDTEVSHYAATALVNLKDQLSMKVLDASNLYEEDPSSKHSQNYLQILNRYIDSGILNKNMRRKNERIFCQVFENSTARDLVNKNEWLPKYLEYMTNSGDEKKTLEVVKLFVENTRKEEAYVSALRATYALKKPEEFNAYLQDLRKEKLVLSEENYGILQFFLEGDGNYGE